MAKANNITLYVDSEKIKGMLDENKEKFEESPPMSYFLKQKTILINLIVMIVIWTVSSFDYYFIGFLVVTFEQVYLSALLSSIADLLAYGFSGSIYQLLGIKLSFIICFGLSSVGGLVILLWGLDHESSMFFLVLVLISKMGISCVFNIVYIAHTTVFPTLFASTSIGFCNFLAKLFTASSSIFA